MSPCIDAPCCGCCELTVDAAPPDVDPAQEELEEELDDDELDDDAELALDRVLDEQERGDFARDDITEPDDELGPWDWVSD